MVRLVRYFFSVVLTKLIKVKQCWLVNIISKTNYKTCLYQFFNLYKQYCLRKKNYDIRET